MQVGGVYRPNFLKLSSGYKKNFKLNGEEARHFLQLDPYCGPSASNFGRADFDGDGQEDEIGWYVMGDDKLVQLGARFPVDTRNERYQRIGEKSKRFLTEKLFLLDQALDLVKKENIFSPWEDHELKLENDAVQIYHCEKSAFILYWDSAAGKFEKYWTGD